MRMPSESVLRASDANVEEVNVGDEKQIERENNRLLFELGIIWDGVVG